MTLSCIQKILHIRNPLQKLLKQINEFSKIEGYEINIERSIVFLYTSNNQPGNEMKKTTPFA